MATGGFDWRTIGCHQCPEWNLAKDGDFDPESLEKKIDGHLETEDKRIYVQGLLFKAYLKYCVLKGAGARAALKPRKALEILKEAEGCVEENIPSYAKNGYLLLIYANKLWILNKQRSNEEFKDVREKLRQVYRIQYEDPKGYEHSMAYAHAARAFALSRLGPSRLQEGVDYYRKALEIQPENPEWLLGKAKLIGRIYRLKSGDIRTDGTFRAGNDVVALRDEEKRLLEKVLEIKPNDMYTKLCLGQNLHHSGDIAGAKKLSSEIIDVQQPNEVNTLVKMAAYYRKNNLLGEAEATLKRIPDELKPAEAFFQVGLIWKWRYQQQFSKDCKHKPSPVTSEMKEYLKHALQNIEKTIEINKDHSAALGLRAEILAKLDRESEAFEKYEELLAYYKDNALEMFRILKSIMDLRGNKTFSETERLQYIKQFVEICVEHHSQVSNTFEEVQLDEQCKQIVWRSFKEIERFCRSSHPGNKKPEITLAWVSLHLRKYQKAYDTYNNILPDSGELCVEIENYRTEIFWGMAMSCIKLQKFNEATEMIAKLEELDYDEEFKISVLKSDLYLDQAKSLISTNRSDSDYFAKYVESILLEAVNNGSLESCYLLLKEYKKLELITTKTARAIMNIQRCCSNSVDLLRHADFDLSDELDNLELRPEDLLDNKHMKRDLIKAFSEFVLKKNEYLAKLCISYVKIEKELSQSKGSDLETADWSVSIKDACVELFFEAKIALDSAINRLQKEILGDSAHVESKFPCIYDWPREEKANKKGKQSTKNIGGRTDSTQAEAKLKKHLKGAFIDKEERIPSALFQIILEKQPMYDKKNNWMVAMSDCANKKKHASGEKSELQASVTVPPGTPNKEDFTFYSTELASKTFEEVQKIVIELDKCKLEGTVLAS